MQLILLETVANLGKLGSVVNVKSGYGRNYLVPQGKAVPATKDNIAEVEARRAELEKTAAATLVAAQARAETLAELRVTIGSKAGEEGKLFGSIGTRDVAEAITAAGNAIEKSEVKMPAGPIRSVGEHVIQLQLHSEVLIDATVVIIAEE